jgi:hypothetical protein
MNGRVYDPATGMFFSPDPYVQAPGDWLNYNRYGYCLNNPFKYTDPSGEFFWILPFISWSPNGGLSIGISAGIGLPGFGAQISVGYGFKQGNFSATAGVSAGGFNAYAGFDTKAGFIAGYGFGFGSLYSNGNFSIGSNILSAGINFSSSGGLSISAFGFNVGERGANFDPSIGASVIAKWGKEAFKQESIDGDRSEKEKFAFNDDFELNNCIDNYIDKKEYNIDEISAFNESFEYYNDKETSYSRDSEGYIHEKYNGTSKTLNGITFAEYRGFKVTNSIYLSRNPNRINFTKTINHELTHAYINVKGYRNTMDNKTFKRFSESSAYMVGQGNIPKQFFIGIMPLVKPPHLMPVLSW